MTRLKPSFAQGVGLSFATSTFGSAASAPMVSKAPATSMSTSMAAPFMGFTRNS